MGQRENRDGKSQIRWKHWAGSLKTRTRTTTTKSKREVPSAWINQRKLSQCKPYTSEKSPRWGISSVPWMDPHKTMAGCVAHLRRIEVTNASSCWVAFFLYLWTIVEEEVIPPGKRTEQSCCLSSGISRRHGSPFPSPRAHYSSWLGICKASMAPGGRRTQWRQIDKTIS